MKNLKNRFDKGWKAATDGAKNIVKDIEVEVGSRKPTMLEQVRGGVNNILKAGRKEFGVSEGWREETQEFFIRGAEILSAKEPRVGKSLVEVIKSAFGLLATVTGTAKEQNTASEKFEKACETFSRAMEALFKTKEKESHKDTKATEAKQKPKTKRQEEREADKAAIIKRQELRKTGKSNTNTGRGR